MISATAYRLPSGARLLVWRSRLSVPKQRWRFRVVAANGEPVGHGEGYTNAAAAHRAGVNLAMGVYGQQLTAALTEAVAAAMLIEGVKVR